MTTPIQPRTATAQVAPVVTQQAEIPVGALYGLPGFTEFFEQTENLQDIRTQAAAAVQTPFNPPASFQKTDIILWWEMETYWNYLLDPSSGSIALSPSAPYNLIQSPRLRLQGQYTPVECESGMDLAFFQMYRPMRGRTQRSIQDVIQANTVHALDFANPLIPQANLAAAPFPGSAAPPYAFQNYPMTLEWPAGIFLDEYWDLALDGTILPNANGVAAPMPSHISPQYMAGGERVISPEFKIAAALSANVDQGPFAAGNAVINPATTVHFVSNTFRRVGIYASDNPAELPPVFNWQYRRSSRRVTGLVGGVTKADIPITEYGQLMSVWIRIFDPSLGTNNSGGYFNIANVTKAQLLYGSNLPRFDDSVTAMQKRFIEQHGFLPPQGTVAWDLIASRQTEKLSNARVLNTLTNANTHIHLEFQQAPGPGSYAVVGTELLVPVSVQ